MNRTLFRKAAARVLRGIREERCLEMAEMADESGLSRADYLRIETGGQDITASQFFHMCEQLGLSPDSLCREIQLEAKRMQRI